MALLKAHRDGLQEASSEDAQHQQEEGRQLRAAAPEPPLPCAAQQLHINRAGTCALVFGHEQQVRQLCRMMQDYPN